MSARPEEPIGDAVVSYRGWEAQYSFGQEFWTGHGWCAYKGGADLDAPSVTSARWSELLDEIDAEEDDE